MKTRMKVLALLIGMVFSISTQAKKVPVYTLIKGAKKILVIQDFLVGSIETGSNVRQTYNTIASEKIAIPTEFNNLNSFIADYLNTKYEVSAFSVADASSFNKTKTLMGKEMQIFDPSKMTDIDLVVKVTYKVNYWGSGLKPEISYDERIDVVLTIYKPREGKMPKKIGNIGTSYISKKNICVLKTPPVKKGILEANYFLEKYSPTPLIDELKPLIKASIDKQYNKLKKKVK